MRKKVKHMIFKSLIQEALYSSIITLNDAFEEQINLKHEINKFTESTKPKNPYKKEKNTLNLVNADRRLKRRQKVLNGCKQNVSNRNRHKENELKHASKIKFIQQYNEFIKGIIQNEYYIYEF